MKFLRQLFLATFLIAGSTGIMLLTGCKNKCGTTTCQNGGSCVSNICECPTGYSGYSCETGWSSASIGTYRCTRSKCVPSVGGITTWQSSITADATNGGFTIDISDFDGSNVPQVGTIDSFNNILISPVAGDGVNAKGSYNPTTSTVTLQFTTYAGGRPGPTCTMTMIKE